MGKDIRTICVKLQYVTENSEESIKCDNLNPAYTTKFTNKVSVKREEFIKECHTQININSDTSDWCDTLSPAILYCDLLSNNEFKQLLSYNAEGGKYNYISKNKNSWFDVFYNCMTQNNQYKVGIIAMEMAGSERGFNTTKRSKGIRKNNFSCVFKKSR